MTPSVPQFRIVGVPSNKGKRWFRVWTPRQTLAYDVASAVADTPHEKCGSVTQEDRTQVRYEYLPDYKPRFTT